MVKHIVNWSAGKDSSAMLIRMVEEDMPIDDIVFIEVMATPTLGAELPEVYEYISKMERYIGRKITVVRSAWILIRCFIKPTNPASGQGRCMDFPLQSGPGATTD